MRLNEVKELINKIVNCDKIEQKINGNFYLMKSFYYKTSSSKEIVLILKDALPNIEIINNYDTWKPFIGGERIEKQSHYYVEFIFNNPK